MASYRKQKEGKMTHNPRMFGYDYVKSHLVIIEDQARILLLMFTWVAEDMLTYNAVATRLNEMGIPSPRDAKWSKATVKRILQNPAYLGTIYLNRHNSEGAKNNRFKNEADKVKRSIRPEEEWISVNIPPIIDEKLFYKVQDLLKGARRRKPGVSLGNYLLSGLVVCGDCDSPYNGTRQLSKTGAYYLRYYRCTGRIKGICKNHHVRADEIENDVWSSVKLWLTNPELLVQQANKQNKNTIGIDLESEELNHGLTAAETEKDRIINVFQKRLYN